MQENEFISLVEKIKQENPVWFGLDSDCIPTIETIKEIETQLNFSFPDDYIAFISRYGGGFFAFGNVYSLDIDSEWFLLLKNSMNKQINKEHLLISENGCGDFYGYLIKNSKCTSKIEFYDHEDGKWYQTNFNNIFEYLSEFALTS